MLLRRGGPLFLPCLPIFLSVTLLFCVQVRFSSVIPSHLRSFAPELWSTPPRGAAVVAGAAVELGCEDSDEDFCVDGFEDVKQYTNKKRYASYAPVAEITANLFHMGWGTLKHYAGLGDLCPFAANPSEDLAKALEGRIVGQPMAVEQLVVEMKRWEVQMSVVAESKAAAAAASERGAGVSSYQPQLWPLVLAITGPTGVGKTETAWVMAEALFAGRESYDIGEGTRPKGFVNFRGEDFSDPSVHLATYHTLIKTRLISELRDCSGRAVVLFDEVQKLAPGVLDVLMEAMSTHPAFTYYTEGKALQVDCSKVVFILVSDIGYEEMLSVIARYPRREDVPFKPLQLVVKRALDRQWEKLGLSKAVDKVIPFLPMRPAEVLQVLDKKLEAFAAQHAGIFFYSMRTSFALRQHLSGTKFVHYLHQHSVAESPEGAAPLIFSTYGARDVQRESMKQLTMPILAELAHLPNKVLDIRYDAASEETVFHWCPKGYDSGLSTLEQEDWKAVETCHEALRARIQDGLY